MSMDFATAEKQKAVGLIPNNTVVPVHLAIRPGGAGEGNWLKRTKNGDGTMLDCELTVIDGQYARRKIWSLMMVQGETEGQQKAADITRSRLRAILESVKGIQPSDETPDALAARRVEGWQDFDGLRFPIVVGIEKGKDGYQDKNILLGIVTPDRKDYAQLPQVQGYSRVAAHTGSSTPAAKASGARPSWAA